MPLGPKGEKRPADVIGNAVKVMRIATGEIEEDIRTRDANAASRAGKIGGAARAKKLSPKLELYEQSGGSAGVRHRRSTA
jgi:hypothetical protein